MKKQHLFLVTVAVILIGAGGYFYYSQTTPQNITETTQPVTKTQLKNATETNIPTTDTQQRNTAATNTPTPTPLTVASDPLSGIDYSSLEKNGFYTNEEVAALSERKTETIGNLLRAILTSPECVQNPNGQLKSNPMVRCSDERDSIVNGTSIRSLKNDKLLIRGLSVKAGEPVGFDIYDLKQKKFVGNSLSGYEIASDNQTLIILDEENNFQSLFYYHPGMSAFVMIPSSRLSSGESYWYLENSIMGSETVETFEKNILKISVFRSNEPAVSPNEDGSYPTPKKIRTTTFDINTLK